MDETIEYFNNLLQNLKVEAKKQPPKVQKEAIETFKEVFSLSSNMMDSALSNMEKLFKIIDSYITVPYTKAKKYMEILEKYELIMNLFAKLNNFQQLFNNMKNLKDFKPSSMVS